VDHPKSLLPNIQIFISSYRLYIPKIIVSCVSHWQALAQRTLYWRRYNEYFPNIVPPKYIVAAKCHFEDLFLTHERSILLSPSEHNINTK